MRILVTGSAGHLGEALARTLGDQGHEVVGLDVAPSPYTTELGSIVDAVAVARCMRGVDVVLHTATLHKPHVATHSASEFVDTNVQGTLNLLEAATAAHVRSFVFTSTTSVFGAAMTPEPGAPAVWVTEELRPVPKNIYGVTKAAAEDLCELFHRQRGLSCIVLRTSRFFPELDDDRGVRSAYDDANVKANEFLHRRVEIADVADAHLLAFERAPAIGFARYIVSATTPFQRTDAEPLRTSAPTVVEQYFPNYVAEYQRRGWTMFPTIDRVYVNEKARAELGWRPRWDFRRMLDCLAADADPRSDLARVVGSKGYHRETFNDGPYPTETPT